MKPSIVVYGPQGSGKTVNAKALAAHYGLSAIVEADCMYNFYFKDTGVLYLTQQTPPAFKGELKRLKSVQISGALKAIGVEWTGIK